LGKACPSRLAGFFFLLNALSPCRAAETGCGGSQGFWLSPTAPQGEVGAVSGDCRSPIIKASNYGELTFLNKKGRSPRCKETAITGTKPAK